ncbi:MAG: helix-turn-helix domain-containing protein [Oligoflexia bacterium]|nr:helix-turn-helix domain-containing protein [Oligoflexia bacterium]
MKTNHQQNYYELLDIPINADQESIIDAYKKARTTYNPNSPALYTVFTKEEAVELIKLIDEAYSVLSNQFKRKEYDKSLSNKTADSVGATPPNQTQSKVFSEFEERLKNETTFSGTFLQQVRLYRNLTVEQVAEVTKISRTYINAIESENYSKLPAVVFLRGFVSQYAKILGLDPVKTSNSYIKIMQENTKK